MEYLELKEIENMSKKQLKRAIQDRFGNLKSLAKTSILSDAP